MPQTQYIQLTIGGRVFDVPTSEDLPVSIDFQMEDEDNFEQKKGATAFDIVVPATLDNSEAMNTFFNPQSEDMSPDNFLKDVQPFSMVAGGNEFMVGKAILKRARKTDVPKDMEIDLYARNGDWAIENSELTLHDVVTDQTHIFDLSTATVPGVIDTSWNYDGSTEGEEFVYAPVRYRETFAESDTNIPLVELKPSLFKYWLIYRGFQRAGYKIVSNFMDSEYFRRQVMPWTFGDFLNLKIDVLRCQASMSGSGPVYNGPGSGPSDVTCDNETTNGNFDDGVAFDPPVGCYNYDPIGFTMNWFYLTGITPSPGTITASFSIIISSSCQVDLGIHTAEVLVDWYINGSLVTTDTVYSRTSALLYPVTGGVSGEIMTFVATNLSPGDTVSAQIRYDISGGTYTTISIEGVQFKTNYFRAQNGSTVSFKNHDILKSYKWIDLFRGVVDEFNLQFQTDSIGKRVYIEPTHPYSIDNNPASLNAGYYTGAMQDWSDKQDLKKITTVENYADYDQVFKIRYKDDENDGMYKLISDRYKSNLTEAMYQFPSRFKKGVREMENRFFGPVMHYKHDPFSSITGVTPQFICIIPENISNSSSDSANNVFIPKSAYYKGLVDRDVYGGWSLEGVDTYDLPFMFAVNYFPGGEDDPILTYCDQKIGNPGDTPVKGMGLFKRFFWQRFAIMRHGKRMISSMKLNNSDALDSLQREFKIIGEGKYQLVAINGYRPLINDSTECTFWLWWPITQADYDNTYPSENSVMHETPDVNTIDPKYSPLLCYNSEIPI